MRATNADGPGPAATRNWRIETPPPPDTTAPNVNITSVSDTTLGASGSSNVNWNADEGGTFVVRLGGACGSGTNLDGGNYGSGTHTTQVNASDLAEGSNPIRVCVTDAATNTGFATTSISKDTTAPTTTIGSTKPTNPTKDTTPTFSFSADESATFECSLTSGFSPCTSSKTYPALSDGTYTFQVRATDQVGNVGAPATYTWRVDTTEPNSTITQSPATPTNLTSATFQFQSNEGGTFKCRVGGGTFNTCTSPVTYTGLTEGIHTFEVQATDDALNVETTPASFTWTIDLTPGTIMRNVVAIPGDAVVRVGYSFPPGINKVRINRSPGGAQFPLVRFRGWRWRFIDHTVRNGQSYTYFLRTLDSAGNLSAAVSVRAKPRDPLITPRDGALVRRRRPPLFRWAGAAGAKRYNLLLLRCLAPNPTAHFCANRKKVMSAFPFTPQYQLPRAWRYRGHWRHLARHATYNWYVYPWFGTHYGRLVGANWFRVR